MAEPRKHHYLPQFYLRRFSDNGTSIFQIEKQGMRAYMCSIHDAAAIRDYHTLDQPDHPNPQAVEKMLAEAERTMADALNKTIERGRFPNE